MVNERLNPVLQTLMLKMESELDEFVESMTEVKFTKTDGEK